MRKKRSKMSQEAKDRISAGMRRFRAKQREEKGREKPIEKSKAIKSYLEEEIKDKESYTFGLSEVKRNLVIFQIAPAERPTEIILDFKSEAISINIPGVFKLSSDNGMDRRYLKDLLSQLMSEKYPGKIEERRSGKKNPWVKRRKIKQAQANDQKEQNKKIEAMENKANEIIKDQILKSIKNGNWKERGERNER